MGVIRKLMGGSKTTKRVMGALVAKYMGPGVGLSLFTVWPLEVKVLRWV